MYKTNRKVQYLAGICVSFAFTFTGASISWPSPVIPKIKNGEANIQITDAQCSWAVSLVVLGALPGCYAGQLLNERVGRRRTVLAAAAPAVLGAGLILMTKTAEILYVARILIGISNGITAVVTMIYLTEIADKEIRGSLGMLVQVMIYLGSLTMYGVGPFVSYAAINWMLLSLPVFGFLLCLWIPESPYYHIKDGRFAEAKKQFQIIKGSTDEKWIEDQLTVIRAHVMESMENKTTLRELLTNMRYRKAIYIVSGLKVLQYLSGSLAIQSYLEVIFRQGSSISGPYASIVYGFVQLAAGTGATFLTGCVGRRVLMFTSCLGVALSLTLVGLYFFLQDFIQVSAETLASLSALPVVGVMSFNVLYAIGLGVLPYLLQAELFPMNVKTVASSTATMAACLMGFVTIKSYQGINDAFGLYTVFWSFASVTYLGMPFIYFFVPETKDMTLEEVQDNVQEVPDVEKLNIKMEEMERLEE